MDILKLIGYFLERSERSYPRIFWFCTLLVALLFNESVQTFSQSQRTQTLTLIERNTASVLAINSGGGQQNEPNYFLSPNPEFRPNNPENSANTRSQNYNPKPKYPWGIDPSHNPGGGSGSALPTNQIPENGEWVSDGHVWDKAQENDSSISEEEEKIKPPVKLEANIDFQSEYDSNGNPTLLVPNPGKARTKRDYIRVEFEQTASHMHHAQDFNIPLPSDFNMSHYMSLDRAGRIDYAKQKLSQETIINYQNEIGKSMSPLFGPKETFSVPGSAGKYKQNTELTIQQTNTPNKTILSIIREDGLHISSYSINDRALRQLTKDNFWVLKNRNL